jgi:hypothetical protein
MGGLLQELFLESKEQHYFFFPLYINEYQRTLKYYNHYINLTHYNF